MKNNIRRLRLIISYSFSYAKDYLFITHEKKSIQIIKNNLISIKDLDISKIRLDLAKYLNEKYIHH